MSLGTGRTVKNSNIASAVNSDSPPRCWFVVDDANTTRLQSDAYR